jgi:ethanolamine utilization protein EutQ (cupin superfamily)
MSDVVLVKRIDIVPEYFDVGENNSLKVADVIAQDQGAVFTFGVLEMGKSQGVEFTYEDDGACCFLLDGEITLTERFAGQEVSVMNFEKGDIVYIPQKKDLAVIWSTQSYARYVFVTYPHWR